MLQHPQRRKYAEKYPFTEIIKSIADIISAFKSTIHNITPKLYSYLQPSTVPNHQTPKFYGLPKVHKKFMKLPPMRPIIAQSNWPLTPSAKFIDHVLQPLAQSYDDYIQNSTALILRLQNLEIPEDAVLVTIDVENLYPSIPQTECLKIIYEEMTEKRHLILTNPNLITKLLHINTNFNYFERIRRVLFSTNSRNSDGCFILTLHGKCFSLGYSKQLLEVTASPTNTTGKIHRRYFHGLERWKYARQISSGSELISSKFEIHS